MTAAFNVDPENTGAIRTEYRCVKCRRILATREMLFCDGVCPWCGHGSPLRLFITEVAARPYRIVATGKWWQFWKRPVKQYLDDPQQ